MRGRGALIFALGVSAGGELSTPENATSGTDPKATVVIDKNYQPATTRTVTHRVKVGCSYTQTVPTAGLRSRSEHHAPGYLVNHASE